jgi:phosphoserine phosphatase
MKAIIDLDDTLLQTEKLKADFRDALSLSRLQFETTYAEYFTRQQKNYNPYKHLEVLEKIDPQIKKHHDKIVQSIDRIVEKMKDYLHPGARELLAELEKKGYDSLILSKGDIGYQQKKLDNIFAETDQSKIERLVISEKKAQRLSQLLKNWGKAYNKYVIFEDKIEEAEEISRLMTEMNIEHDLYYIKHKSEDVEQEKKNERDRDRARELRFKIFDNLTDAREQLAAEEALKEIKKPYKYERSREASLEIN